MHRRTKEECDSKNAPSRVEIVAPSEEVEKILGPSAVPSMGVSCVAVNKDLDW